MQSRGPLVGVGRFHERVGHRPDRGQAGVAFFVGIDDGPGAVVGVGFLEHVLGGLDVVVPA